MAQDFLDFIQERPKSEPVRDPWRLPELPDWLPRPRPATARSDVFMDLLDQGTGAVVDYFRRVDAKNAKGSGDPYLDMVMNYNMHAPVAIGGVQTSQLIQKAMAEMQQHRDQGNPFWKENLIDTVEQLAKTFAPKTLAGIERYVGPFNGFGMGGNQIVGQPSDDLAAMRAITSSALKVRGQDTLDLYRALVPGILPDQPTRSQLRGLSWSLSEPFVRQHAGANANQMPTVPFRNAVQNFDPNRPALPTHDVASRQEILATTELLPRQFPMKGEGEVLRLPEETLARLRTRKPTPPEFKMLSPEEIARLIHSLQTEYIFSPKLDTSVGGRVIDPLERRFGASLPEARQKLEYGWRQMGLDPVYGHSYHSTTPIYTDTTDPAIMRQYVEKMSKARQWSPSDDQLIDWGARTQAEQIWADLLLQNAAHLTRLPKAFLAEELRQGKNLVAMGHYLNSTLTNNPNHNLNHDPWLKNYEPHQKSHARGVILDRIIKMQGGTP